MLIYDALKQDHETVKGLLEQLVASSQENKETREKLIQSIRDELIPHSRAEEAVFYNYLREIDSAKDLVHHSYAEHMEAEALLRSLQAMDVVNADWEKTAQKLKKALEHHISEEEGKIFSAARQLLIDEEAEMMTEAFRKIKPEVREGNLLQNTLDMVANMLPEKLANPLRSFSNPMP